MTNTMYHTCTVYLLDVPASVQVTEFTGISDSDINQAAVLDFVDAYAMTTDPDITGLAVLSNGSCVAIRSGDKEHTLNAVEFDTTRGEFDELKVTDIEFGWGKFNTNPGEMTKIEACLAYNAVVDEAIAAGDVGAAGRQIAVLYTKTGDDVRNDS